MSADEVRARLDDVRAAYDAARALRARQDELRSVEQARAAYDTQVAADEAARAAARDRLDRLEDEWRRGTAPPPGGDSEETPWPFGDEPARPRRAPGPPPDRAARLAATQRVRRSLRTLVNRYRYVWKLDPALLGRINCIADDADRPLGEALVLLPWEAFPAGPSEAEAAHRTRLVEWEEALREYRDRLAGEVNGLEAQYEGWMGIWHLWLAREGEGAARWETFLAQRRLALREEAERLRLAADALEGRLRGAGGVP